MVDLGTLGNVTCTPEEVLDQLMQILQNPNTNVAIIDRADMVDGGKNILRLEPEDSNQSFHLDRDDIEKLKDKYPESFLDDGTILDRDGAPVWQDNYGSGGRALDYNRITVQDGVSGYITQPLCGPSEEGPAKPAEPEPGLPKPPPPMS